MEKIFITIRKGDDGTYWANTENIPGIVVSCGDTLDEMKTNFSEAFYDNMEVASECGEDYPTQYQNAEFVYQMDLSDFFTLVPEVKISAIAKKAGINESLLRQYKNGLAFASEKQTKKILDAVHQLGNELLSVRF